MIARDSVEGYAVALLARTTETTEPLAKSLTESMARHLWPMNIEVEARPFKETW